MVKMPMDEKRFKRRRTTEEVRVLQTEKEPYGGIFRCQIATDGGVYGHREHGKSLLKKDVNFYVLHKELSCFIRVGFFDDRIDAETLHQPFKLFSRKKAGFFGSAWPGKMSCFDTLGE